MDRGWLFENGFTVRPATNESFIVVLGCSIRGEMLTEYAFTDANDLMAFLTDEKDAFLNRKAPAP